MQDKIRSIITSPLQSKFLLYGLLMTTIPILVLGGLSLYLVDLSHRNDVAQILGEFLDQKSEEIVNDFQNAIGLLDLRVGYTQTSEIAQEQQDFILQGLLDENKAFEDVRLVRIDGTESARKTRSGAVSSLVDVSNLPYITSVLEGDTYTGEIHQTLSGPVVTVASPVRNANDNIVQILVGDINLSSLVEDVERARIGDTGWLVLLDQDGRFIAGGASGDFSPGQNLSSLPRVEQVLRGRIATGLDPSDIYMSPFKGVPVVGANRSLAETGWFLMAEWPLEEADMIMDDIRKQVINVTLLAILAVIVTLPIGISRLITPIQQLTQATRSIKDGDFNQVVNISTHDEVEELGIAFNDMMLGLQRLEELRNEFVFISAHELRAPVTAMKGYLSMLREGDAGELPEQALRYIDPVWKSNERLVQLVNDLLEIARSEAGRIEVSVTTGDLREVVGQIVDEARVLAQEKNITLSYDQPKQLLMVRMDPSRVAEIAMNLISNAIKYNNEGGNVTVRHYQESDFIVTEVEDNGFGMSPEDQEHMFEKFFRSKDGQEKDIPGTGLGMFITKELVEKMGGTISFNSTQGKGTTFRFTLPLARVEESKT